MSEKSFCKSLFRYARRQSGEVRIGAIVIGGNRPVAVQTMTNTDTNDTRGCVEQIARIRQAGGRIVRLTAQGEREGRNLEHIAAETARLCPDVALVADIHFLPAVALIAADHVNKVRINPGNYNDKGGDLDALIDKCARRGVALRIGVNHGSLARRIVEQHGDTPQGMVASAMEYLRRCRNREFDQVVVSMKSSNTRVMVHAYRLLVAAMQEEGMRYPLHLGVTEAGNDAEGRIKSAVGIGALLADGIGDTIRVSLTEVPENEIPVAQQLVDYFAKRDSSADLSPSLSADEENRLASLFNPYEYVRRKTDPVGRLGGSNVPLAYGELDDSERKALKEGEAVEIEASGPNPIGEWRLRILTMTAAGDRRPVILRRHSGDVPIEILRLRAAADFGVMFLDGLADGLHIESSAVSEGEIASLSLDILQAARARISRTEYIACPGCGRTRYDLQKTLDEIKSRTSHLKGLKIGVMGCIVNGPGEMADADYGYVGAAPGCISLYRSKEIIQKNIPQEEAIDRLISIIRADGRWNEPEPQTPSHP